jgi:muconolactone D-isomerase
VQEFFVRVRVNVDPNLDPSTRQALLSAERARGEELVRAGNIRRIWRVPGTQGNVAIWAAEDATVLHALLSSLPHFLYMDIEVVAIAEHPLAPIIKEVGT